MPSTEDKTTQSLASESVTPSLHTPTQLVKNPTDMRHMPQCINGRST